VRRPALQIKAWLGKVGYSIGASRGLISPGMELLGCAAARPDPKQEPDLSFSVHGPSAVSSLHTDAVTLAIESGSALSFVGVPAGSNDVPVGNARRITRPIHQLRRQVDDATPVTSGHSRMVGVRQSEFIAR